MPEDRNKKTAAARALEGAVGRIRTRAGPVVGSAFLVDGTHLLTCAHVVTRALGLAPGVRPGEDDVVDLDFPLVAPGVLVKAVVESWTPVQEDESGDIAVLALRGALPADAVPAQLVADADLWGHTFRAFGFPRGNDHGIWAAGELLARQGVGWVQLQGSATGCAIEGGFSGGAVWDDVVGGVIGMTVAADADKDHRTAYVIPAETLMQAWPALSSRTVPRCPYRGLSPFRAQDADIFFGRADLVDRLVGEVAARPVVALVGPSGSGKSSIVFAGLIPKVLQQDGWSVISMRPSQGSSPLIALATALLPALEPDGSETERLANLDRLTSLLAGGHLLDVVNRVVERDSAHRFLLVVDQFEEVFGLAEADREAFLHALLPAIRQRGGEDLLCVALTLRADFLEAALEISSMARALEAAVITVGRMGRKQLRSVVEGPLPPDVHYEGGLVPRILDDVGDDSGSLPLLQFALTLLWERQQDRVLTHEAYEQLGGVSGALASYAERVFERQLSPEDQARVRGLLLQLVRPSVVGAPVRRVARRSELDGPRWSLGQRLAGTRLLVADRDVSGEESVELVHEALIGAWSRLRAWVDEDSAFRTWQEQVRVATATWVGVDRDLGALLRGVQLAEAERWLTERRSDVSPTEVEFITASRALRERTSRALKVAVAVLTCALLVACVLGVVALQQSQRATEQADLATSRALTAQIGQMTDSRPDAALLLAAAAHELAATPEAIEVLTSLSSQYRDVTRFLRPGHTPRGLRFHPSRDATAVFGNGGFEIWDLRRFELESTRDLNGDVRDLAFSPDGRTLAFVHDEDAATRLSLDDGPRGSPRTVVLPLTDESSVSPGMSFSLDGSHVALCASDRVLVYRTRPLEPSAMIRLSQGSDHCSVGFSQDGTILAADGAAVRTWDADSGAVASSHPIPASLIFPGPSDEPASATTVAVSPDGASLIFEISGQPVWWDVAARRARTVAAFALGATNGATFSPDGGHVLIGLQSAHPTLLDAASGDVVQHFHLGGEDLFLSGRGQESAVSRDGTRIATVRGSVVAFADKAVAPEFADIRGHVQDLVTTDTGIVVADGVGRVVRYDGAGDVQDVPYDASPRAPPPSFGPPPLPDGLQALAASGHHLAVVRAADPKRVLIGDLRASTVALERLATHRKDVVGIAWGRGQRLASADQDEVLLWSLSEKQPLGRWRLQPDEDASTLAMHPDGDQVAVLSRSGVSVYTWRSGTATRESTPLEDGVTVAYSPDGRHLAVSTREDTHFLRSSDMRAVGVRAPPSNKIRFSTNGDLVALHQHSRDFSKAGMVSVWTVPYGRLVGTVSDQQVFDAFAFFRDDSLAVGGQQSVDVISYAPDEATTRTCSITRSSMSEAQWLDLTLGVGDAWPCD